jgi:hypothetical protein
MNKIFMAIYASLFISWSSVHHSPMGQHGTPFIRDIQEIAMAFLALIILEGGISLLAIFIMIVFFLGKMDDDIFNAVRGLGIEEFIGVIGSRKMTIHTVCHKSLCIINVG